MPGLHIPPEDRPGLFTLAKLDPIEVVSIAAALAKAPMQSELSELAAFVASEVQTVNRDNLQEILESIRQIALVKSIAEVPSEVLAHDVVEVLRPDLAESEAKGLDEKILSLIDIPSIELPAKARSLMLDHDNSLCGARIFTDIRPVFGSDVGTRPSAAVIVNTLKITYHHDHSRALHSFFVTLDQDDVEMFIELLERARTKTNTLRGFLSDTNVEPIDIS